GRVPEQPHDAHRVDLVGRFQHREVEAPVGLQLIADVATLDRLLAVARRQGDPLVGIAVELRQRPARRPPLDQPAQVIDLAQVVEVELGDEVAASRPVGELALLLEHRQRFAHRRQAQSEPLGDLLLAHLLARSQLAGDEGVTEAFYRVLGGGPQARIFEIRSDWGRLQRVTRPTTQRESGASGRPRDDDPGGRLISFGGLLADLVVRVDAVPERGADVLARGFSQTVGGGFAVVVAAARLGMATTLAGVLGNDPIADAARRL